MCPPTSTFARGEGRVIRHTASVVIVYILEVKGGAGMEQMVKRGER